MTLEFYVVRTITKTVAYRVQAADARDARNRVELAGGVEPISGSTEHSTWNVLGPLPSIHPKE